VQFQRFDPRCPLHCIRDTCVGRGPLADAGSRYPPLPTSPPIRYVLRRGSTRKPAVRSKGGTAMRFRASICILATAVLLTSVATVQAFDDAKYPDFSGLWRNVNFRVGGQTAFDPTKPWGKGQQAPLTPEYEAV